MRSVAVPALLVACGGDPPANGDSGVDAQEDYAATLVAPGPHGVGYAASSVSYADAVTGTTRTMHLAAWYPSTDETAGETLRYRDLLEGIGAAQGATPAAGPFPVALFSHGHQGFAEASSFLMTHLASHGWLVVAPDHTNNTFFDGPDRDTEIYVQRPLDITATLDAVLGDGVPEIAGMADADAVVVLGHSFGGYGLLALAGGQHDLATLLPECEAEDPDDPSSFCSTMTEALSDRLALGFADDRVDAWMPLAPGDYRLFGADGLGQMSAPVLLMTGSDDPRTGDDAEPYWDALAAEDHRHVQLVGGGHQSFTDYSGILESFDGLIDRDEGFAIVGAYTLAFARRHALGESGLDAVLDGDVEISAEATLQLP